MWYYQIALGTSTNFEVAAFGMHPQPPDAFGGRTPYPDRGRPPPATPATLGTLAILAARQALTLATLATLAARQSLTLATWLLGKL